MTLRVFILRAFREAELTWFDAVTGVSEEDVSRCAWDDQWLSWDDSFIYS